LSGPGRSTPAEGLNSGKEPQERGKTNASEGAAKREGGVLPVTRLSDLVRTA
jgi:hypothetical protein